MRGNKVFHINIGLKNRTRLDIDSE